jgi:hypothetical protein
MVLAALFEALDTPLELAVLLLGLTERIGPGSRAAPARWLRLATYLSDFWRHL